MTSTSQSTFLGSVFTATQLLAETEESMMKKIETDKAPAAIGPYSQGIVAGDFFFASGSLP